MGGWTVLAAAAAFPNDYRTMVLEGSSTGAPFAVEGSTQWPRNLAVVFSKYDEFSALMWGVPEARNVVNSHKLWKVFGTGAPVQPGEVYGSPENGTARVLYAPAVTHPMDHISPEAIGYSLDWFQRNLKGGTPLPAGNQIWYWKEICTLVALVGFLVLLLGVFDGLLTISFFAPLAQAPAAQDARNWRWCLTLALMASIPVLTYFRFFQWGGLWLKPSSIFPQGITNQIMIWALLNAVITLVLTLVLKNQSSSAMRFTTRWLPSVLIAVVTICIGYAVVLAVDFLFKTDFRFWIVAIKRMSLTQFKYFFVYLIPFTIFFIVTLRALHAGLSAKGDSPLRQYVSNLAALSLGFLVFLLLEYVPLFLRGRLLTPSEPLNIIVAIQFLPLMAMVAVIATFTYRRTNSYLPGAVLCGLLVTWYIVAGQATQAAVS
jgi:hypothetical protein